MTISQIHHFFNSVREGLHISEWHHALFVTTAAVMYPQQMSYALNVLNSVVATTHYVFHAMVMESFRSVFVSFVEGIGGAGSYARFVEEQGRSPTSV